MRQEDEQRFALKMYNMARALDRKIDADTVDVYSRDLAMFPIDAIEKAIDIIMAAKSDSLDLYDQRALPTVPEIKREARDLMQGSRRTAGCEKCNNTGFIIEESLTGQGVARRCECLQEIVNASREASRKRKR